MTQPLTVEYSQINDGTYAMSKTLRLNTKTVGSREYTIERRTAGYRVAGSAARWTDVVYAVSFNLGGAFHGKLFSTLAAARDYYKNLRAI